MSETSEVIIRLAELSDEDYLAASDHHIGRAELTRKIEASEILVATQNGTPACFLRWNLFWDNTPFMNLIYVEDSIQNHGIGSQLTRHWENLMKQRGFARVLTSSLSNERAQHFYRKLGYRDCGSLLLPCEPLEIFFIREI